MRWRRRGSFSTNKWAATSEELARTTELGAASSVRFFSILEGRPAPALCELLRNSRTTELGAAVKLHGVPGWIGGRRALCASEKQHRAESSH